MTLKEINENLEKKAQEYSKKAHKGQYRKFAEEEYSEHPRRVAEIVRRFKSSKKIDNLVSAAFLHDTIEDTNTTIDDLKTMFGGLVGDLVQELTSNKEEIKTSSKRDYLLGKMKDMSSWALVIKLADRLDNVSDLKNAKPEFAQKYKRETEYILDNLEKQRELTNTQKTIIQNIREKLEELNGKANEEFENSIKLKRDDNNYYEIFLNPSSKELNEIKKVSGSGARFIFHEREFKFYAFPAEILHEEASNLLGIPYKSGSYYFGMGRIKNGKIVPIDARKRKLSDISSKMKKFLSKFLDFENMETFDLAEEFEEALRSKIDGEYYEIFKNPSKSEIKKIGNDELRIIIDKKKADLYVFDANLLHMEAKKRLNLGFDEDLIKTATVHVGGGKLLSNNLIKNEVRRNKRLKPVFEKYFVSI